MLWAGGCCNAKPLMVRWDGDRYGAKEDWEDEQRRLGHLGLINVIIPSSNLTRQPDNTIKADLLILGIKFGICSQLMLASRHGCHLL